MSLARDERGHPCRCDVPDGGRCQDGNDQGDRENISISTNGPQSDSEPCSSQDASEILKVAIDPVRLNILLSLADAECSVDESCAALEQSQSAMVQHFALLRHGGLIAPRIRGKQKVYSLTAKGRLVADAVRPLLRNERPRLREIPATTRIDSALLEDVSGFVDDPDGWFHTPNVEFEGRRPIELLGTPDEQRLRERVEAAKLGMFS
jgi:DNA-binding transcriptional ArsR family regulator